MARKSTKNDVLAIESDVVESDITVEEALTELSRVDIVDWPSWRKLPVVSNVSETDDEDDGPREVESDLTREMIELIGNTESITPAELLAKLNADADTIWPVLKDLTAQGYAIFIADDGMMHFGMTAMAKVYEKMGSKTVVVNKTGRKQEVLDILKRGKHVMVKTIAAELGITDRNVSSQLSYLRADGYKIATDSRGYKFLED